MSSSMLRFLPTTDTDLNPNPNPNPDGSGNDSKKQADATNLGNGSEVMYIPRFIPWEQAWEWYERLDKEIPWTRPLIRVFGKTCVQPRESCYIADKGLTAIQYSGYQPPAYAWDDYPVVKDILKAVHEALPRSNFNSVVLNRYRTGSDYVAWHSDEDKSYGPTPEIASVSFGCEREFLLKKKPAKRLLAARNAEPSSTGKQLKNKQNQHSFLLKHGSLLLMKGNTQRDFLHSVPKRMKAGSTRINLTFRRVLT